MNIFSRNVLPTLRQATHTALRETARISAGAAVVCLGQYAYHQLREQGFFNSFSIRSFNQAETTSENQKTETKNNP